MSYNYRPMYIGAMSKLFYSEKTNLAWRISFIAGVSNIVLNLIFIPMLGFEAAAFTTFASLMYLGFSGHFIRKIKELQNVSYYPLFWLCIILLSTVIAYFVVDINVISKLVISVIVLLFVSYCLLYFKSNFAE